MTINQILDAVGDRKITLREYERIVRRHIKIELELHRIGNVLALLHDEDGRPLPEHVTDLEREVPNG